MIRAPRSRQLAAAVLLAALLTPGRATPTTVVALTFDEVLAGADEVFIGQVVDQRSVWEESRSGRLIVTLVTFRIERTLKGAPRIQAMLEFVGGTIGEDTMRVAGVPRFQIGDRDVLFLSGVVRPVSPVVGLMQGRFRIVRDPDRGVDTVLTFGGDAVATLDDIGRPTVRRPGPRTSMTLDEFVARVAERVARQERRP
jgi:hypothetical protein